MATQTPIPFAAAVGSLVRGIDTAIAIAHDKLTSANLVNAWVDTYHIRQVDDEGVLNRVSAKMAIPLAGTVVDLRYALWIDEIFSYCDKAKDEPTPCIKSDDCVVHCIANDFAADAFAYIDIAQTYHALKALINETIPEYLCFIDSSHPVYADMMDLRKALQTALIDVTTFQMSLVPMGSDTTYRSIRFTD